MWNRRDIGLMAARLVAASTVGGAAAQAQDSGETSEQKARRERNVDLGEADAKQMLILMDKDKSGKVSKQEFMSYMEAEFDRLDVNHDGELDVKELTKTRVRIGGAIHR